MSKYVVLLVTIVVLGVVLVIPNELTTHVLKASTCSVSMGNPHFSFSGSFSRSGSCSTGAVATAPPGGGVAKFFPPVISLVVQVSLVAVPLYLLTLPVVPVMAPSVAVRILLPNSFC